MMIVCLIDPGSPTDKGQLWRIPQRRVALSAAVAEASGDLTLAYIFDTGVEDVSGAQPERTTKGFVSLVTSNVTDFAEEFDIDTWETFLENVFEDGSNEKLLLCGNTALTNINKVGRIHGELQMTPGAETYGLMMRRYATPYGFSRSCSIRSCPRTLRSGIGALSLTPTTWLIGFFLETESAGIPTITRIDRPPGMMPQRMSG